MALSENMLMVYYVYISCINILFIADKIADKNIDKNFNKNADKNIDIQIYRNFVKILVNLILINFLLLHILMTQELLCHILFHSRRYSRLLFKLNDKFYSKIEDYAIELHQTTCLTKFYLLQGNLTKLSYIPKICLKFVNLKHKYIALAMV